MAVALFRFAPPHPPDDAMIDDLSDDNGNATTIDTSRDPVVPPERGVREIVHLASHDPPRDLRQHGVYELSSVRQAKFDDLADLPESPRRGQLEKRARKIAKIAEESGADAACIRVPIALVSALERKLRQRNITPLYPHGKRRRYKESTPLDGIDTVKVGFRIEKLVEPPEGGDDPAQ